MAQDDEGHLLDLFGVNRDHMYDNLNKKSALNNNNLGIWARGNLGTWASGHVGGN